MSTIIYPPPDSDHLLTMKSENIAELSSALSKAQGQIKHAKKDSLNLFFKTKFADLASIQDACSAPLSTNGLSLSFPMMEVDDKTYLTCLLMHTSGQWIKSTLRLRTGKDDMQSLGSSASYARRYLYAAIVNVATEDDDGEGAVPKINNYQKKLVLLLMKNCGFDPRDQTVQKRFRDLTSKKEMGYWTEEDANTVIELLEKKLETQEKEKPHDEVSNNAQTDSRMAPDANQKGNAK